MHGWLSWDTVTLLDITTPMPKDMYGADIKDRLIKDTFMGFLRDLEAD